MPERFETTVTSDIEIDTSNQAELNKNDPVDQETIRDSPHEDADQSTYQYAVTVAAVEGGAVQAAKGRLIEHGYQVIETYDADRPLHISGLTG